MYLIEGNHIWLNKTVNFRYQTNTAKYRYKSLDGLNELIK